MIRFNLNAFIKMAIIVIVAQLSIVNITPVSAGYVDAWHKWGECLYGGGAVHHAYGSTIEEASANFSAISCPAGGAWAHVWGAIYESACEDVLANLTPPDANGACVEPPLADKDDGGGGNCVANPCNAATGNKYQPETDVSSNGLSFTRSYNSRNLEDIGLGKGWRNNHQKMLVVGADVLIQVSGRGRGEWWTKANGLWQGDADSDVIIIEDANDDFTLTRANGVVEKYNASGRLLSETDPNGQETTHTYNAANQLAQVTNHYGLSLTLAYANGKLDTVTDAGGAVYAYEYDAENNLATVVMPDSTPGDPLDNPSKIYHYENTTYPNHLTGITDENGDRFATWSYDSNGKAITSEHAQTSNTIAQERFELDYQSSTTTLVTDAVGTDELWTFQDVLGTKKLTSKINQTDNKGITQTWDANGNKLSRTDAEGRVTTYAYNATNQRTSMTEASGTPQQRTTVYEYVSADIDLVEKVISPSVYASNTKEVVTTYDANLNVTAVTTNGFNPADNPVTRSTSFSHDPTGKVTQIDGPRTNVSDITILDYYECTTGVECGQLEKITNALGQISLFDSYDAMARLTQSTDANGVVTTYAYHPRGWLLSRTQTPPNGAARVTAYEYDNVGQLTKTTLPDNSEQHYVYDAAHDLREIYDNLGNKIEYRYDAKGNRTDELIKDPDGTLVRSTITAYDMRNFVESINSAGSITQMINDAVGNTTSQTDPKGNPSTQHQYDALDRLQQTIDALGNSSNYQYDDVDRITQVTAPNNAQTDYVHDDLGNLLSEASPDRGIIEYQHDNAGNVTARTDARNIAVTFTYDALNRLTNKDYPGTDEDITFSYDSLANPTDCAFGLGSLCEQTDNGGTKRYEYDAYGNVVEVTHEVLGNTFVWDYSYDVANRVTQVSYPGGRAVTYTRDAIGRITDMSTTLDGIVTDVINNRIYRGDGLMVNHQLGNGLWATRTHDLQGRLLTQTLVDANPRTYNYDANGNILDIINDDGIDLFTYDGLDRLTDADLTTNDLIYGYDANGNRTSLDTNGQVTANGYDTNTNRLNSIGSSTITRDAAGNTQSDQSGNRTFEYNQAGRLDRVLINSVEQARYDYDANGLRINKITPTDTTIYQYGLDGKLLAEMDDTGTLHREYLYADNELVAMIVTEPGTPTVTAPADITVEASAVLSPVILGSATAVDVNGNPLTATSDNTGPFPLGQTTVSWIATANGVQGVDAQQVTVVDTTPPVLVVPDDITVESAVPVAVSLGDPTATDPFSVVITNDAPALFPVGTTAVTWTAVDDNSNSISVVQTVTVVNVVACALPTNIASEGTASQSSDYNTIGVASKAINGDTTDNTATAQSDNNASWELNFTESRQIEQIILHNRDSCCVDRFRDLLVSVEDDQGVEVYLSALLNPENILSAPEMITLDIPPLTTGTNIKVKRIADPDLSGGW